LSKYKVEFFFLPFFVFFFFVLRGKCLSCWLLWRRDDDDWSVTLCWNSFHYMGITWHQKVSIFLTKMLRQSKPSYLYDVSTFTFLYKIGCNIQFIFTFDLVVRPLTHDTVLMSSWWPSRVLKLCNIQLIFAIDKSITSPSSVSSSFYLKFSHSWKSFFIHIYLHSHWHSASERHAINYHWKSLWFMEGHQLRVYCFHSHILSILRVSALA